MLLFLTLFFYLNWLKFHLEFPFFAYFVFWQKMLFLFSNKKDLKIK